MKPILLFLLLFAFLTFSTAFLFRPVTSEDFQHTANYVLLHLSDLNNTTLENRVKNISHHILKLTEQLREEEGKLKSYILAREAIKNQGGIFWPFHPELRKPLDLAQLKISEQGRAISSLFDHINLHWREIKGSFGIYSRMFLWELSTSVLELFLMTIDILFATFSWGILWFLFTGPLMFASALVIWKLGIEFWLPATLYILELYWLIQLPSIIFEYNPTFIDFVFAYFPIVAFLYCLNFQVGPTFNRAWITPRLTGFTKRLQAFFPTTEVDKRPVIIPVEEVHSHHE